ncbi:hypothetical protein LDENG_00061300 [Lucifuga dentata]|nr:hypothetical protein LDENG_00061300 [Lucifuga dentata]
MVVNLCLPHFQTTVHCNKLCADGYDVTNLVSADPAVRRRGFKLEYFLRPPVEVTLKFGFQVELCRVDVELWPWGMDRGQACKRLEISTSSDPLPAQTARKGDGHKQGQGKDQKQTQLKDQTEQGQTQRQQHDNKHSQFNCHPWSLQAKNWGEEALDAQRIQKHTLSTESTHRQPEFKLVGRCELREETQVCFSRSHFSSRPPFLTPPPPQPQNCRQEELWSRGLLSLGSVTQLRVTVPFGGAASALGLKALEVWGQPAHCCPAEDVERIKRAHECSERRPPSCKFFAQTVIQPKPPLPVSTSPSQSVPEEFLDAITQEVMMLPMLLPSGVSVDKSTLEEHQKREATWGRPPNDPFTGVPFTAASQPLPNPQLKSRIDRFLLQTGVRVKDGMLGRQGERGNPQPSRLAAPTVHIENSAGPSEAVNSSRNTKKDAGSGNTSEIGNYTSCPQHVKATFQSDRSRKRDSSEILKEPIETSSCQAEKLLLPQTKRRRNEAASVSSCGSHEQRLSASLDEALFSALQGRPSFTSDSSQQRRAATESEPSDTSQQSQITGTPSRPTGKTGR